MLISPLALLVMVLGLVLYFACTQNAKAAEVGRILFWTGLAFTLWPLAQHVVRIG